MKPSDLKKVFERRRKSAPHLFMSAFISPSHVFAVYPVTASCGGKWNYTVCARWPKVNMYCDYVMSKFFPYGCAEQLYCFHTHIILKDESPDNIH